MSKTLEKYKELVTTFETGSWINHPLKPYFDDANVAILDLLNRLEIAEKALKAAHTNLESCKMDDHDHDALIIVSDALTAIRE